MDSISGWIQRSISLEAGGFELQFFGGEGDYFALAPNVYRKAQARMLNNQFFDRGFEGPVRHAARAAIPGRSLEALSWLHVTTHQRLVGRSSHYAWFALCLKSDHRWRGAGVIKQNPRIPKLAVVAQKVLNGAIKTATDDRLGNVMATLQHSSPETWL